ncbi:MAG TPA: hypothetical protein VFI27_11450 [candidate division Zixibacteria bacterium]|nr:hypothetical protein [candidate division Zixibacteria bacterium]
MKDLKRYGIELHEDLGKHIVDVEKPRNIFAYTSRIKMKRRPGGRETVTFKVQIEEGLLKHTVLDPNEVRYIFVNEVARVVREVMDQL